MIHKNITIKYFIITMLLSIYGTNLYGSMNRSIWLGDGTLKTMPGNRIIYKTIDTVNLALDIIYPPDMKAGQRYPAIIFFSGGGWNGGSVQQFEPHAIHFAKRGMITVRADYRVKSRHGTTPFEAVEDAKSAIRASANSQKKPNVLFIAVDDLNDWVGCLGGHPQAITPNIDKLASRGMLFTNAHCQAPICGPSRASIMTGLYPSTSGNYLQVKDNDIKKAGEAAEQSVFLPDYFEKYGYKTLGVGKIYHSGDEANTFDEYGGIFEKYGPRPEERMNFDPAWFGYPNGTSTDWGAYPEYDSLMPDYKSANWAVEKLNAQHEKPFFLAVGFIRPHVPWFVPQKWFDIYSSMEMVRPPYNPDDFNDIPEMGRRVAESPQMPTTEYLLEKGQWEDVIRAYLACVTFVDAQIGRVLDALEGSDYAENTIVVLWGDHGYHLGEKNRFAKQSLWERDTRVPLVIRQPGAKAGETCNAPVGLVDLYPTLLDLAGLPANPMNEGNSLRPLLKDPSIRWEKPAISFYGIGNVSVRDERYRLIRYEDGSQEFYDMQKDPNEWTNLALKRKYSRKINRLSRSIPDVWATNSPYSTYNWNDYFRNKTDN
jgi:arylsulfatase A-like enzyme